MNVDNADYNEVTIAEIHPAAREAVLLKLFDRLMKDAGLTIVQTYDSVLGYQYTLAYRTSTLTKDK